MIIKLKSTTVFAAVFCIAAVSYSAIYNSVRVDKFDWKVHSTENFDIYYYEKSLPKLPLIADILENSYSEIGSIYDCFPKEKTPFFIYSNHNEFEQTNIVQIGEGTGGVTEAFKNRFTVFNSGSDSWLEQVIRHEYTHIVQFNVLYGGFWKSARLLKSFFYALWLMEGTAEYSTGDIDGTQREMYLRDASTSGGLFRILHLMNFNHLKPHQITLAYKQSESVIRFIEYEYGKEKIPELFKLMKTKFDAGSFLRDLLRQDLFSFEKRYNEYMLEKYSPCLQTMNEPEYYGQKITQGERLPVFNTNPVFAPDGKYVYYISDRDGHNAVYRYDLKKAKSKRIFARYFNRLDRLYTDSRALDITPDGKTLIFAAEYKQKGYICTYGLKNKKLKMFNSGIDDVKSPKISSCGQKIVFVGMENSINNIYMTDINGEGVTQLTNDNKDNGSPCFGPNDTTIYYTSEDYYPGEANKYQRNIYALDTVSNTKSRITDLPNDEISPVISADGKHLYFTNDSDGVLNMYRIGLDGPAVQKLTNVIGGIFTPAVWQDGKLIAFSSFRRGETQIYIAPEASFEAKPQAAENNMRSAAVPVEKAPLEPFAVKPAKYSFKASTDLIFPIFFYSSLDGFFSSVYYQASDYLGNHKFQTMLNYGSKEDIVDYDFAYIYSGRRPNFIFGGSGENYYRDFELKERSVQHAQYAGIEYPLSRINSFYFQAATVYREERYREFANQTVDSRENVASVSVIRDTRTGRYLYLDSGSRARLSYEYSDYENLKSDYQYKNYIGEYIKLLGAGGRPVLASRLLLGTSDDKDKGVFRLGGFDRVKGYPRRSESYRYNRIAIANFRYEIPLIKDIDYYMWYFFPDFFFKELHLAVFTDFGLGWNDKNQFRGTHANDIKNSFGAGLHFYTFVLQSFQLNLNFDWVKRTDSKNNIFYFTLGPVF